MKISIVIPNYNGEILIKKNFPQVIDVLNIYAKKHDTEVELVVNDDGSQDKSRELLAEYQTKKRDGKVNFTILFNERNFGFSTTVNRGVAKANGDIVVLLNTDVVPDEGFLEPLVEHFSDQTIFAVGCMDKSVEPEGIVLRGRGVGVWKKGFLHHSKGELDKDSTLWVSGGSGAFRKSVWDKLGGLNQLMDPFYWEDIDLSYRAQKAGYFVKFDKRSTVTHEHEEGAIKKSNTPMKVKITSYRNQFYFLWINITDKSLLLSHFFWLPIQFIYAVIHKDTAFLKGLWLALHHLGEVLKRRKKVQQQTKVSDHDVLKRVTL